MSVNIIDIAPVIQNTFDLDAVGAKLRQIFRILWSVLCITGSAYGIEKVAVTWPTISSMVLPAYFVLALVILYVGHLVIDLVIDFVVVSIVASNVGKVRRLQSSNSSNEYFSFGELEVIAAESHYKKRDIEVLLPNDFEIVRNALSTIYGVYSFPHVIRTTT